MENIVFSKLNEDAKKEHLDKAKKEFLKRNKNSDKEVKK